VLPLLTNPHRLEYKCLMSRPSGTRGSGGNTEGMEFEEVYYPLEIFDEFANLLLLSDEEERRLQNRLVTSFSFN